MRTRTKRRNPAVKHDPVLLVDSHHGIYVPQAFAERFDRQKWGIKAADHKILLAGPDHEYHWETWEDVLNYAQAKERGTKWFLYQDMDLWAVPENFDFEQAGWI